MLEQIALVTTIVSLLGYALGLLLVPVVLLQRREPVSAMAWIMSFVLAPVIGPILYFTFGTNRVGRRVTQRRANWEAIDSALPHWAHYEVEPDSEDSVGGRLMALATRITGNRAVAGNRVELILDTNRAYGLQEQAILEARRHVHLEYYIFQPDATGRRFRDLLIAASRRGVQVRFVYDAVGSLRLNQRFLKPMRDAGVHISTFLPINPLRRRFTVNLRNHRKLMVVDGRIGFTGGLNVGDEYIGRRRQFGYWRDTHIKLEGPAVLVLQRVFARDWYFATEEDLRAPELYPDPGRPGSEVVQIIESGPDADIEVSLEMVFSAIASARRRVFIETCYFVPPESICVALQSAAHRGVDVKILVPAYCAHRTALLAAQSYYAELLASGVEIYQYARGLLHAKILTIDGVWSMVGSANIDNRSLRLNFEVGAAFYNAAMAQLLEAAFHTDLAQSEPIDAERWSRRSLARQLMESTCRLLSPVL